MSQVEGCGLSGSEEDDECASSPAGSAYDDQDMIKTAMSDEVTKQLAAAGPVGMAAAAAIASSKKRKRPHSFETNPSVRKRHQNRLLRKLRLSYSLGGARWRKWLACSAAVVELKQLSQWSDIGWVTKNYDLELLRASEGTLSRWSRLHLQSLAPTNPHWARVVGHGPNLPIPSIGKACAPAVGTLIGR
ncbi:hypothetical protein evm_014099 [Chilo suppressalis]|nr:hypothetical protein evm_014099 [Chilo suppressalis]